MSTLSATECRVIGMPKLANGWMPETVILASRTVYYRRAGCVNTIAFRLVSGQWESFIVPF